MRLRLEIAPAGWHVMLGRQVAGQTDDPAQAAGAVSSLNLTFKESFTAIQTIPRYPLLESAALTTYFRPRGPLPFKIYFRERVFSQPLLPLLLSLSNQGEQICTKIGG